MIEKYGEEVLVTATRESLCKAASMTRKLGDMTPQKARHRTAIERKRHDSRESYASTVMSSG